MVKLIVLFLGMSVITASAQSQPELQQQQRLRAYDTLILQRNQAMDTVAYCIGEMQSQIEALKKQLEEARKQCIQSSPPQSEQ